MFALDWRFSDPSIEEFIIDSHDFKIIQNDSSETKLGESFKLKEFIAYANFYSYELVTILR